MQSTGRYVLVKERLDDEDCHDRLEHHDRGERPFPITSLKRTLVKQETADAHGNQHVGRPVAKRMPE